MKTWHKTSLVVTGAVLLSTVAIQAGDIMRGIEGNLAGSVIDSESPCGLGAVSLNTGNGTLCVDQFEASAAPTCPVPEPGNGIQTQENLNELECAPQSRAEATPWRFVSLTQAQQLCARSGKRLPTNEEWYTIALAQTDQSNCVLTSNGPQLAGTSECVTQAGIADVVGNVWEWVNGEVIDGVYRGRSLPESGFVSLVDSNGIVLDTAPSGTETYGEDYAKTNPQGVYGMIRGGFYDSKTDGGVYAQNLAVPLSLQTDGVGFRCVKSL